MNKRSGQAAVEYLIILAVVIIIALVVVGVLGGFPTLTAGVSEKDSLAYWQTADISIEKPLMKAGSGSSAIIRNNKPFSVTFKNMTASNTTGITMLSSTSTTLSPGQTATLTLNTTFGVCIGAGQVAGIDSYSNAINITYTDASDASRQYLFIGAKNLVGKCA